MEISGGKTAILEFQVEGGEPFRRPDVLPAAVEIFAAYPALLHRSDQQGGERRLAAWGDAGEQFGPIAGDALDGQRFAPLSRGRERGRG